MPRYIVERTFQAGLHIPVSDEGATICRTVDGDAFPKVGKLGYERDSDHIQDGSRT